jgi:hypothetical protein
MAAGLPGEPPPAVPPYARPLPGEPLPGKTPPGKTPPGHGGHGQGPCRPQRRRFFDELGRWLGAYLSGEIRDQLL